MRIGQWIIRTVRWAIVIERAPEPRADHYDGFPNPITDLNKKVRIYPGCLFYSADDIKKWQDGHMIAGGQYIPHYATERCRKTGKLCTLPVDHAGPCQFLE